MQEKTEADDIDNVGSTRTQSETQRLLVRSGIVDLALGTGKVLVGVFANSHALIADGIHSYSDLGTDIMVWVLNRIGVREPDSDHPYGHARFETIGTLVLGGVLIAVAGVLVSDSVTRLLAIEAIVGPTWPALAAALVSILVKEWLYVITKRQGERTRSSLLLANAWHHRSDALSSVIVLLGVGGALMGFAWLEMVATIGVAFMIALIGWRLARESVEELVDTALSEADVAKIKDQIEAGEGVRGVHDLRTRRMGPAVVLDIHLQVDPAISVSEGHQIGDWATSVLLAEFHDISDVTVHIDAEDDKDVDKHNLIMPPLGPDIRAQLTKAWQDVVTEGDIEKINLHYLSVGINVELFLAQHVSRSETLKQQLIDSAQNLPWMNKVMIWYR